MDFWGYTNKSNRTFHVGASLQHVYTKNPGPTAWVFLFSLLAPREGLSMLSGLVHFELLALAVIVLLLVFVLLFVKGSIGFVGHRIEFCQKLG